MPKNMEKIEDRMESNHPVVEWYALMLQTQLLTGVANAQAVSKEEKTESIRDRVLRKNSQAAITLMDTLIAEVGTTTTVAIGLKKYLEQTVLDLVPSMLQEKTVLVSDIYKLLAPAIIHIYEKLETSARVMPLASLDAKLLQSGAQMPAIYTTTG